MKKYKKLIRRIQGNHSLMIGIILLFLILSMVFLVPLFVQLDYSTIRYGSILKPPSLENIMGTDDFGRDLFARVIEGGKISLLIGLMVMLGTAVLGTTIALLAGYFEKFDLFIMRLMDLMMSFPSILLAIALVSIFSGNINSVSLALIIVYLPRTVRIVRSSVLTIRNETYIEAARSIGTSTPRILFDHILPGVLPTLIVQETFLFAYAILAEAGLSFVGIGVKPPDPSWGNILADARVLLREAPWMIITPGICIMLSVLSLNLIGDGLRELLDPKRQKGLTRNE